MKSENRSRLFNQGLLSKSVFCSIWFARGSCAPPQLTCSVGRGHEVQAQFFRSHESPRDPVNKQPLTDIPEQSALSQSSPWLCPPFPSGQTASSTGAGMIHMRRGDASLQTKHCPTIPSSPVHRTCRTQAPPFFNKTSSLASAPRSYRIHKSHSARLPRASSARESRSARAGKPRPALQATLLRSAYKSASLQSPDERVDRVAGSQAKSPTRFLSAPRSRRGLILSVPTA